MENFKANIYIYFTFTNHSKTSSDTCISDDDLLKKLLNSIFVALKGDAVSTPDFDTNISILIKDDKIELSISGNNVSKFRATILSFLRLTDVAYSTILLDK